ncbi:hypothetical protein JNMOADIG_00042 [Aeromonas phage avDM5]|uniref:Uncharacterized protein n=1 Tax=Aeromonas phage vB_AehM_DM2 TaxID=2973716 RepID=A0AA94YSC3_9CAUD|nr:hypothetical protein JNMOADIG_00042 [Aeromonas phage avDM5]UYD60455.1 hypothetical protein NPHMPGLK_00120 [Aeromonas phage avDM2]UYD60709.1 hypothetical protein NHNEHLNL_00113 [Aeromonas phage avDM2]
MFQIIFIAGLVLGLIACCFSTWDSRWRKKARNEQAKINTWLAKYGISMNFKNGVVGAFGKVVFFMPGGDNAIFSECKGINFRKAYKMLEQIRKDDIANPDFDQTGNLMSILYLSQAKIEKTIWDK